jgi:hypothetical protein
VKEECEGVAWGLVLELEKRFPDHEVMIALRVIYSQFWATNTTKAKSNYYFHLNVLKATFCVPCKVGQTRKIVLALLSSHNLDLQCSHFKMTMIHNFEIVMCDSESNLNPMIQLWCKITISPTLNNKLLEYMKLAEITDVQVLGLVEDEHTFSTLNFMKNRL